MKYVLKKILEVMLMIVAFPLAVVIFLVELHTNLGE